MSASDAAAWSASAARLPPNQPETRASLGRKQPRECRAVGAAEPRAGVPAGTCGVGGRVAEIVVAARDVAQRAVALVVEKRVEKPDRCAPPLVQERDERGPEWGDGARAAHRHLLPVDEDAVAGLRVGVAGHVGDTAADASAWIGGRGNARRGL